jgi:hypothetical protein
MNQLAELKDKLLTTAKILQCELHDMWEHVSAKTPDGERFLLAMLRPPADANAPVDDVLEFDMSGRLFFSAHHRFVRAPIGQFSNPSKERAELAPKFATEPLTASCSKAVKRPAVEPRRRGGVEG